MKEDENIELKLGVSTNFALWTGSIAWLQHFHLQELNTSWKP